MLHVHLKMHLQYTWYLSLEQPAPSCWKVPGHHCTHALWYATMLEASPQEEFPAGKSVHTCTRFTELAWVMDPSDPVDLPNWQQAFDTEVFGNVILCLVGAALR